MSGAAVRLAGAAWLAVACAGFAILLYSDPPAESPDAFFARFPSSASCESCHPDQHREWKASRHAFAFVDPEVRKLSNDFAQKECIPCHAPEPVLRTGLYQRVLARYDRLEEGVDCIACHRGDTGFVGPNEGTSGECRPVADPAIRSDGLCFGCHNQHGTHDEWKATPFASEGVGCVDCHMPRESRPSAAGGRARPGGRHEFRGMLDLAWSTSALRLDVRVDGETLVVEIENTGAGHNVPTDSRHKALDLALRVVDTAGATSREERVARFRNPYRDEPGENTQLRLLDPREFRIPLGVPHGRAVVTLRYKTNPFQEDHDATIVLEREVEL